MQKTINLFVDMDGTIAKFYYKKNCLEKMYEQGYFAKLPFYSMATKLNDFAEKDTCVNIYILSACVDSPYCEEEKTEWLLKNMPNINPKNFIFTKVGESKLVKVGKTIENYGQCINILLDDYTESLKDWQQCENCIGIKFLNGMNDTTKNWQGLKIKTFGQLEEIIRTLAMYGIK
jgi:5'(3')-deoxyribonucleotidase